MAPLKSKTVWPVPSFLTGRPITRFTRSCSTLARRLASSSINLVYPPGCVFCESALEDSPEMLLCMDCQVKLAPAGLTQCPRCAAVVNPIEQQNSQCSRCRDEPFRFDRVFALARYQGSLRDAVLRMKHSSEEPLMMAIGQLLANRFSPEVATLQLDVVVPIPMHWTRRLVRGTNSPEMIGEVIARQLGLVFAPRSLRRRRRTRKLAELTRQERKRTLRDAFAVAKGCDFAAARVLLVDDVLTTGTTCDTAARTLRKAGAATVSVLVAARAYPND
jgi:ComF family protein